MDSNASSIMWFFKWYFCFVWKSIIMPIAVIWAAMKWVLGAIGRISRSGDSNNGGGGFFSLSAMMSDIKNFRLKIQ